MAEIVTHHIDSPVPGQMFAWVALYVDEGEDDTTIIGLGMTEWEARQDLIDQDRDRAWAEGYHEPNEQQEYEPDLGC